MEGEQAHPSRDVDRILMPEMVSGLCDQVRDVVDRDHRAMNGVITTKNRTPSAKWSGTRSLPFDSEWSNLAGVMNTQKQAIDLRRRRRRSIT